ncbi:MAG: HD domain-containing protein [Crenarchaeota archaeon]|nr:HD domain-containing protein [Thermoproteota archaeon]
MSANIEKLSLEGLLKILRTVDSLCSIPRIGWVQRSVSKFEAEDVGKHILLTSYIGLILCNYYKSLCDDKVNCDKVSTMCLIHDVHEASIGNIAGDVRRLIPNFRSIELKKLEELFKEYPLSISKIIGTYFLEYRESTCVEAILVRISDKISTLLRACRYIQQGNREVIDLAQYYINEVRNLLSYVRCEPFKQALESILAEVSKEVSRACSS